MNGLEENKRIAMTILEQMGGASRISAMIGVDHFDILSHGGVMFKYKARGKGNCCIITYDYGWDLYKMKITNIRTYKGQLKIKEIYNQEGLYFDMLKPEFEQATGLYLSL